MAVNFRINMNYYEEKQLRESNGKYNPLDSMLQRFNKILKREDTLKEYTRHTYFLKKSLRRKEKAKRAKIRRIQAEKNKKRFNSKRESSSTY